MLCLDRRRRFLDGEFGLPDGRAPAAGWVHKIWREPGREVLVLVELNTRARDMIREGEYQCLGLVEDTSKAETPLVLSLVDVNGSRRQGAETGLAK